uniref:Uncharacterized protein n=1 Tax=Lactuca sativa TaxID=4236 RepID=A0A9R1XFZ2_LACSA|nr:hypothetical protein LSAT_V11C400170430 [Lactuca sativa]
MLCTRLKGWFLFLIPNPIHMSQWKRKDVQLLPEETKELDSKYVVSLLITARNESRGIEAVKKLHDSGLPNIVFHQLDINDPRSIERLTKIIETNFKKLDILINNAALIGIIMHEKEFKTGAGFVQVLDENAHLLAEVIEEPYELGEECLQTNYFATKSVTEALIPLLQLSNSPRIVNVTSSYGELRYLHNEKLKEELRDMKNENGWPLTVSAYKVSKVVVNAYTRVLAKKFPNFIINCVHPGYVETDMTIHTGFLKVEEGARAPVMVALLPDDGPSGVYFQQMEIAPF